ncbi:hypothetical protein H8E50_02955, partial [bacterium]|nr:hypothetical protein [bacterium]
MTQDPYTSEQSKAQKPIDPIGSLVSHWLKILIFGMILFSLTAPLGIYMSKPFYDSVGKLRIAPVLPTLISRAEESSIISYYNDYVLTQIELIYEHDIIESSLENLDPELKKQFVPEGISISRAASMLAGRLQVSQIPETHIVQLYMDGDDPDGLAEIINSVMNAYLEKLRGEEEGKDNRRLTYLRQEKDKIENDIAKMTAQLQQITLKTGTSTINQGQNIFTQQLQDLQRTHSGAYEKRVEKESMYIKAVSEAKDMNLLSLAPVVNELVYRDPSIHETRSWTHKQIQEMEVSLEGATMDNPDRRFQDKRKKEMEAYLQELKSEVRIETTNILDAKRKFELRQRVINAKADYEAALQAEKTILDELERIKLSASEAAQLIFQGHQIGETLRQSRTLLDRLDDRIHEIKLESRAPGRVILESLARTPELASGNNKTKNLSILFIFSFFSITALTIIYDIFDDRITSVKDVTNALGFTPSWPISDYLITGDGKLEFSRVTIDDPQNVVSKAVRSLAVRLNREREEHDARVAVFTGVNDKSGNTSILINTA